MEFNLLDIVQHILNVVVLYVILRAILYRPVRSYMLAREEALKQQRAEADQYRKDAEDLKAQSQKLLEEALYFGQVGDGAQIREQREQAREAQGIPGRAGAGNRSSCGGFGRPYFGPGGQRGG